MSKELIKNYKTDGTSTSNGYTNSQSQKDLQKEDEESKKNEMVQINIYNMDEGMHPAEKKLGDTENDKDELTDRGDNRDAKQEKAKKLQEKKRGANYNPGDDSHAMPNTKYDRNAAQKLKQRGMADNLKAGSAMTQEFEENETAPQLAKSKKDLDQGTAGHVIEMEDRLANMDDHKKTKKGQKLAALKNDPLAPASRDENLLGEDEKRLAAKDKPRENFQGSNKDSRFNQQAKVRKKDFISSEQADAHKSRNSSQRTGALNSPASSARPINFDLESDVKLRQSRKVIAEQQDSKKND